jgi:hypothetical protein
MKLALAVTLTLISAPACAQWQYAQPYWPQWTQFEQPAVRHHQPRREQPRREHTRHERKAEVRRPVPIVKTRTVMVHHEKSWRDFDQDGAREWITQQAQGFCGKYPSDQACHKKEP